jgi:hypothetical protein
MGLDPRELRHLLLIAPYVAQRSLCKQGQHDRGCWGCCQALVPWELLGMRAQVETDLALDDAVDQQAHDGQHRSSGHPFGFLPPHGADRRRILAPAKAGGHSRVLLLLGLEHLGIRTGLRTHRRGQHGPAIVLLQMGPGVALDAQAIA